MARLLISFAICGVLAVLSDVWLFLWLESADLNKPVEATRLCSLTVFCVALLATTLALALGLTIYFTKDSKR
jgi:hypothetical protein